ncbi:MAG: AAA family ATPase [Campylobacterota bacterium]|nr:AAA family ATPase [Campylobacterota bacterium]
MRQKLPIGISDFREVIEENYYYIDKTNMIDEILRNSAKVILLPRPRRFGKTLNLSMLRSFFDKKEQSQELFANLAISQNSKAIAHNNQYPVIYLTFKDIKERDFTSTLAKIESLISDEFLRHKDMLDSLLLEDIQREKIQKIIHQQTTQGEYENSIKLLTKLLTLAYDQKCVVLIDEYDTPIQTGFIKGYYTEIVEFFKTFMGAVLKDNDRYLFKAVMTGILRVSKESIFSDLNNIEVYTLLNKEFSNKFGFTTDEVKKLLEEYNLFSHFDEINNWYNGYNIGGTTIFNPWSLLSFCNRQEIDVYWANTSSNDIIRVLVENSDGFREDLKYLLKNQSVTKVINPNITFRDKDFHFNEEMLYSFLFFSGYLKCISKEFIEGEHHCELQIVNTECYYIFKKIIANWVSQSFTQPKIRLLLKSLTDGELDVFEEVFSEFVRDTLSYYDTAKRVESVYHAFFLGLLVNLSDYEVISNAEAGYGRVDILLYHKDDKSQLALVIELKSIRMREDKESALENAVNQIKAQEYPSSLIKKGYNNILAFALVFDGKRVWIREVE